MPSALAIEVMRLHALIAQIAECLIDFCRRNMLAATWLKLIRDFAASA
jgi:hypothetical protein